MTTIRCLTKKQIIKLRQRLVSNNRKSIITSDKKGTCVLPA